MGGTSVSDQQGCVVFAWELLRSPPGTARLVGVLSTPSTVAKRRKKGLVTMVTSPVVRATAYKYRPVESSEPSKRSAATACRSRSRISTYGIPRTSTSARSSGS